jgi:hypothetical protein
MTGFRTATDCCLRATGPENTEENGDRVGGRTLAGGGALSRSRETTVELQSDSEYSDCISGEGNGLVSREETTGHWGEEHTTFESNGHGVNDSPHGRPYLSGQFDLARVGITWD